MLYHDGVSPRMHRIILNYCRTIFGDVSRAEALQSLYAVMGLDEAAFDDLPHSSFSAAYFQKDTARLARAYGGRIRITSGFGVGVQGTGDHRPTPETIRSWCAPHTLAVPL